MTWDWASFASGFFIGVVPSYVLYLYDKKIKIKQQVEEVIDELGNNLLIAQKKDAWTEYSLTRKANLTSIKKILGESLCRQVESIYLELEQANQGIKRVPRGNWFDEIFEKYYGSFISKIQDVLEKVKKKV